MKNIIKNLIFVFVLVGVFSVSGNLALAAVSHPSLGKITPIPVPVPTPVVLSSTSPTGHSGLTAGSKPSVLTIASNTTETSVTLNGIYISNGASTTTKFEYSPNQSDLLSGTAGIGSTTIPGGACQILQTNTSGSFSCTLTVPTITAGTTYYVRAIASNIHGTVYGAVTSIQTNSSPSCSSLPTIVSMSPNNVNAGSGSTTVTITGTNFISGTSVAQVNGSARATNVLSSTSLTMTLTTSDVAYATTENITVTNGSSCTSSSTSFVVNNAYVYSGGGGGGGYSYYTTVVSTENATNILNNSAVLNGIIRPGYFTTNGWFEYGTSSNLSSYLQTSSVSMGSANTDTNISQTVNGLTLNTTYYFRVVANNSNGTVKGNIFSFTAGNSVVPNYNAKEIVTTVQAINQTSTSARLNGIFINQDGLATQAYFQYGTTTSMDSNTAAVNLGTGSSLNLSDTAKNLLPGTIYYFRAVAVKQGVVYNGKILVFKTLKASANIPTNYGNNNTHVVTPDTTVDTGPVVSSNQGSSILEITNEKKEVSVNDEIDYLVTFKNDTSENFKDTEITIQLPKGVDFKESNFGKMGVDNSVVFDVGVLVPSQVGSMTIKGSINSKAPTENILVTTAIMSYDTASSKITKDEIAYVTNNVIAGTSNDLAANSIFGASFLPSSLLGWLAILFAIFCFFAVTRKVYMDSRKN